MVLCILSSAEVEMEGDSPVEMGGFQILHHFQRQALTKFVGKKDNKEYLLESFWGSTVFLTSISMIDTVGYHVVVVSPTQLGINPLRISPLTVEQLNATPLLQGYVEIDTEAKIGALEPILFERYKALRPTYSWIYIVGTFLIWFEAHRGFQPHENGRMHSKNLEKLLIQ